MDVRLFFPINNIVPDEAVEACASCPVSEECLENALRYELHGYWAGTRATERERIRTERGIKFIDIDAPRPAPHPGCGTVTGYRALLKYYKEHPDATRVMCENCLEVQRISQQRRKSQH